MNSMHIAFESTAATLSEPTGIGNYAASLMHAMQQLHPEAQYDLLRFSAKDRLYASLRRTSLQTDADIAHFFNYIIPHGIQGKTVVSVHDMVIRAYPETMRLRTRLMLQAFLQDSMTRADCILTDSRFSAREIAAYYPQLSHKIKVLYCGIDRNRFYPVTDTGIIRRIKHRHSIAGKYILYLGTIEPRKNLLRLIQAYRLLLHDRLDVPRLVLAGGKGWHCGNILRAAKPLCDCGQIVFTDYVPANDLAALYSGAECFVFPSLYEGFGMPPLEAMACGTPVVCSRAASLPEVVGKAALQFDPYSVRQMADAIQRVLNDAALRQRLREKGFARVGRFTWQAAAIRLYAIYEDLLKGACRTWEPPTETPVC
ncbi:MAG: glycosyltransferase family 4 protein [Oscillospiraceae bacterium]